MPINRDAVYTPNKGEVLVVRGAVGGKTTNWALQMSEAGLWLPNRPWTVQLTGQIRGAEFMTGVDDRIERQRLSIDAMLDHLKVHCPQLLGTAKCEYIGTKVSEEVL